MDGIWLGLGKKKIVVLLRRHHGSVVMGTISNRMCAKCKMFDSTCCVINPHRRPLQVDTGYCTLRFLLVLIGGRSCEVSTDLGIDQDEEE